MALTEREQAAIDGVWSLLSDETAWAVICVEPDGMPIGKVLKTFGERMIADHEARGLVCGCKVVENPDDTTSLIQCEKHWLKSD